jgi:hypothetical protein
MKKFKIGYHRKGVLTMFPRTVVIAAETEKEARDIFEIMYPRETFLNIREI